MSQLTANQKRLLSDLSLLFVAFVWGGGFVAVKDALNTVTPMVLMSIRFVLATAVLYLFLHRHIGKISLLDFKKGSVVGFIFSFCSADLWASIYNGVKTRIFDGNLCRHGAPNLLGTVS